MFTVKKVRFHRAFLRKNPFWNNFFFSWNEFTP